MGTIGRKPADAVLTSDDINDGTITPDDLSTGHPTWDASGNVGIGVTPSNGLVHAEYSSSTIPAGYFRNTSGAGSSPALTARGGANNQSIFVDFQNYNGNSLVSVLGTGGISFNGDTAAANALDDYEEGTWTPIFVGTTTNPSGVTYDIQNGIYTKIGNKVTAWFALGSDAITSVGSGALRVDGLPFQINQFTYADAPYFNSWNFLASADPYTGYGNNGTTTIILWKGKATAASCSDLATIANANRIVGHISYTTNS